MAQNTIDLNGIWQHATSNPQQPQQRVLIVVIKGNIDGINLDRVAYLGPGAEWLRGVSSGPNTFKVSIRGVIDAAGITKSKVAWVSATVTALDADHFKLIDSLVFTRVSNIVGETACDTGNPLHVSGDEAEARAIIHEFLLKDVRTAVCWYRIGAEEGNAQAQSDYGFALDSGVGGMAKDPAQAFAWYQKSAMNGNFNGAANLYHAFDKGEGAPKSEQRSKYWAARAQLTSPEWFHQQKFLPVPSWAADIVGPCDPAHPPRVDMAAKGGAGLDYKADGTPRNFTGSAQAFAQGRVAYEARALSLAACWFQVAADSPVTDVLPTVADVDQRANVYLGIQYAFGLGVEKNPARGFEYMKKAADAGDNFGMMYLANFYRYGLGTKPDPDQAIALVNRVLKAADGLDAYMRAQGVLVNGDEALKTAMKGFSAIAEGVTCQQETVGNVRYLRDCVDHEEEFIKGLMQQRPARRTIDFPEEIWPEHFDAAVPPEFLVERGSGMPFDRHGQKTQ